MWIYDKNGKLTDASIENAQGMISEGGGYSALWPRGSAADEEAEFERLKAKDLALIPDKKALAKLHSSEVHRPPVESIIREPEPAVVRRRRDERNTES